MPLDGTNYRPVSPEIADRLEKMDKVIALLAEERKWCKGASFDRGRRCIVGAMSVAHCYHVAPIVQAITDVMGHQFGCDGQEIVPFNDAPETTHADVVKVLHRAREIIASRATASDAKEPA